MTVLILAAFGLAALTGCLVEGDPGEWEHRARISDFAPLGDTAFAAYLEIYSQREFRGTGDLETRMGRSGFVVFDRKLRAFRNPGKDIPLSAAHALPWYFLGCEAGRPAWLRVPGTPRSKQGSCSAAGYAASPGATVAVMMGQDGRQTVHDRAMDTLGLLAPLHSALVLRIDEAAETLEVQEFRDYRMHWKRLDFAGDVLDSAMLPGHVFTVQEAGWGLRLFCPGADTADTAGPCWRPAIPGLEAAIRAECNTWRCAWDPGSGRLMHLDGDRAAWIDPATGAKEEEDWLEPALAWGR